MTWIRPPAPYWRAREMRAGRVQPLCATWRWVPLATGDRRQPARIGPCRLAQSRRLTDARAFPRPYCRGQPPFRLQRTALERLPPLFSSFPPSHGGLDASRRFYTSAAPSLRGVGPRRAVCLRRRAVRRRPGRVHLSATSPPHHGRMVVDAVRMTRCHHHCRVHDSVAAPLASSPSPLPPSPHHPSSPLPLLPWLADVAPPNPGGGRSRAALP